MKYRIEYLPIARKDLTEIVWYIAGHLKAEKAAFDLLDDMEKAIAMLETFPYAHQVYHPVGKLDNEYRMISVKNYAVFYVVREPDRIVEIHRVLYARMDLKNILDTK